MNALWADFRFALRTLKKSPVFTAVAILSLALGIGANTAIFTLIDQLMLRMLPVKNPGELVQIRSQGSHYGSNRGEAMLSYPMYQDYRDKNQVFTGVICRRQIPVSMSYEGATERIGGELVSGNYFGVLGVPALLGRVITPDDDKNLGAHPVVVLSYAYWKNRFGGNPSILGKTIHLNSYAMTVVGVTPEGFEGVDAGFSPQVRIPIMMKPQMTPNWDDMKNRRSRWVQVFARLKPGVTLQQAKASLQPLYHQIIEGEVKEAEFARSTEYTRQRFLASTADVLPASRGFSGLRSRFSTPLSVLMCIVGLVLLIACANVANLMVARATSRQKEIAIRLALGASRRQIIRQLLVESVLLSFVGGALGMALSVWTVELLLGFLPAGSTRLTISSTPDIRILCFNLVVSLCTGMLFGLIPALQSTRPDLAPTLKDQVGAISGGSSQVRFRKFLVVAQVSLSLLLLIGAGLFIRSLQNLKTLDPGFRTERLLRFTVDPSLNGYSKQKSKRFYQDLLARMNSLPGVKSAGMAAVALLEGNEWDSTVTVEGYQAKQGEDMNPYCNAVTPRYFESMGIPLVEGRDFNDSEIAEQQEPNPKEPQRGPPPLLNGQTRKIIVNEKFATYYFGKQSALGRHVGFGGDPGTKTEMEIIGVIKDSKYTSMRDDIPKQLFVAAFQGRGPDEMTVYARTSMDPEPMFSAIRRQVQELDSTLPIYSMRTLETQLDQSLATERLVASLSSVFGLLATGLAIIGLYGVMAYTVARRSREIGIRMALGALSGNVVWMVMREVLVLVGIGVLIGLPAAYGLSKLVQSQLYGITPNDPVTIAGATLILAAVASMAGYIPALRASRVDPIRVLRYE